MIQMENPKLACADAGPISAAFSDNPTEHHTYSGKMRHQLAKSFSRHRQLSAVRRYNPACSAHQNSQP